MRKYDVVPHCKCNGRFDFPSSSLLLHKKLEEYEPRVQGLLSIHCSPVLSLSNTNFVHNH